MFSSLAVLPSKSNSDIEAVVPAFSFLGIKNEATFFPFPKP
jgi:hypothetical protein